MPTTTAPMTATTSTQTQTTGFTATAIPVTVHKLATGQFPEAPCPTSLEDIPKAPIRHGTPWPNAGSTSEDLFETRKDWPIPPTPAPTSVPTMKTEAQPQVAAIPKVMIAPRQAGRNCTWGSHCPICEEDREHEEDWDGNLQNPPRMLPQNAQPQPQELSASSAPVPQATKCSPEYPVPPAPKTFSAPSHNCRNSQQSFDIPDRYAEEIKLGREWEEKIERLNEKYNLECFSSSELDF